MPMALVPKRKLPEKKSRRPPGQHLRHSIVHTPLFSSSIVFSLAIMTSFLASKSIAIVPVTQISRISLSGRGGIRSCLDSSYGNSRQHTIKFSGCWRRALHASSIVWRSKFSSLASTVYDDDEFEMENDASNKEKQNLTNNLASLQQEICRRTNNPHFNVNSPKQVSMAIFGDQRSCTKKVLQKAVMDFDLGAEQRQLALMILKCKQLLQEQPQQDDDLPPTREEHDSQENKQTAVPHATVTPSFLPKSARRRRPHTQQAMIQSHEQLVETLFASPKCKLDPYWKQPLLELSRPVTRELLLQLNSELCPVAFDPEASPQRKSAMFASTKTLSTSTQSASNAGRKGTFLDFVRQQKETYPQCVMLVRCGDFYETYGTDAVLLMEHVGLNSMGGKVKAGCPYRNIQATLDGLTQQGFSVAVFEEMGQVVSGKGGASKLKDRILTQIVSPASPTYLYDNWLLEGSNSVSGANHQSLDGLPPSRPCVGVIHTAAGYNMVEVSLEERSVQYSERLTAEAVACRLAAYPPADPLVYVPTPFEQTEASSKATTPVPAFLPSPRSRIRGNTVQTTPEGGGVVESYLGGYRLRTKVLLPELIPTADAGRSDADRYIQTVVETFLDINERQHGPLESDKPDDPLFKHQLRRHATADDFTVAMTAMATNPLYVETATQLGLMNDKTIPSLIHYVLDEAAPMVTRRFLQRHLLIPPPPSVSQSMSSLVGALMSPEHAASLPPLTVPNVGKVLSLIRAGQAGANVYGELLRSLATTTFILIENDGTIDGNGLPIHDLLNLCQHESGLPAERLSLLERCQNAIEVTEQIVSKSYHVQEDFFESYGEDADDRVTQDEKIPGSFFERNELTWRGRVQPAVALDAYRQVEAAARELCAAVKHDFILDNSAGKRNDIVHSINDNLIALKGIPSDAIDKDSYFHPRDRNGKVLRTRWTTQKVIDALSSYISACENAQNEVSSVLSSLAETLQDEGHVPAIVQSAHFNLVLSTAFHHSAKATKSGWQLAMTIEESNSEQSDEKSAHFVDVFPYWMDRSTAVPNTFDLSSMILLTAPNMSGKSTLMRSTAAAALLTICGLCAPLSSESKIPRFDTLFLRGASADVPTEDKSAFGAEMGDLSALFRCCGPKSMVFVDELARGTSPYDGTRLAGAVLEAMAEKGMIGFFATHLHGIIDLNLRGKDRIRLKRMAILHDENDRFHDADSYEWTYQLEDGVCTDSLALVTAERFGLPSDIIERADQLGVELEDIHPERFAKTKSVMSRAIGKAIGCSSPRKTVQPNVNVLQFEEDFESVIGIGEEVITDSKPVAIPPLYLPPPHLSNQSCLYVLQLTKDPPSYYIGETDDLPQRLKQHRKKGGAWKHSRVAAFPIQDKTKARCFESQLIRQLAQSGFRLESTADGRTARQFRN